MGPLLLTGLRAVATVFVAHAFIYALVGALPRTGIAVLGLSAAQESSLSHFLATTDPPESYLEALARLITMEFGKSLDGVAVSTLMAQSTLTSLPVLGLSLGITATTTMLVLVWPHLLAPRVVRGGFEFLTFLPAFVPAFVILAVMVSLNQTTLATDGWQRTVIASLSVSVMPTSLALTTIRDGFDHEMSMGYTRTLRAMGLSRGRIVANLRKAVVIQIIAIADKIVTLQIAVLIFTEVIFAIPGFGNALLLAAQRTDINALIAFVVVISATVATARLLSTLVLARIDPRQRVSEG